MTYIEFCAGWAGGTLGILMGHPLDTIKVRQQLTKLSVMKAIHFTLRYDGITGLYKGILIPLCTVGLNNAVFFGVYANTLRYLEPNFRGTDDITQQKNWPLKVFCAGCVAGIFTCGLMNPAEIIKIRIQAHTGTNKKWAFKDHSKIIGNIKHIYRVHGFRGYYKGIMALLWRDVPGSGLYILSYCAFDDLLKENELTALQRNIIAGGCAGVISWLPVIPFDVIKSRMQADSQSFPQYHGMLDCMRKSYKSEGLAIFGQGFTLSLIETVVLSAAVFAGYEQFIKFFG